MPTADAAEADMTAGKGSRDGSQQVSPTSILELAASAASWGTGTLEDGSHEGSQGSPVGSQDATHGGLQASHNGSFRAAASDGSRPEGRSAFQAASQAAAGADSDSSSEGPEGLAESDEELLDFSLLL